MERMQCQDFEQWRRTARSLILQNKSPDEVFLSEARDDLFSLGAAAAEPVSDNGASFSIPRAFLKLAQTIRWHRDPDRWQLLYKLLWELRKNPRFLEIATDANVHRAEILVKQIRRDMHKMTAFVRFQKFKAPGGDDCYLAWYEPDHLILEPTLPFFVKRFGSMTWMILTPEAGAAWNQQTLSKIAGPIKKPERLDDEMESLWRTYYGNIFNPARIKIGAMKKEMPVRFWKNLPEAQDIPELLQAAPARVKAMIELGREMGLEKKLAPLPEEKTLPALSAAVQKCEACNLCQSGRPAVFGEGSPNSRFVLVGEQPGDQEDLQGRPFVGPAGQLLREILDEINAPINEIYFTNAVKHFRFEQRGGRRLHKNPGVEHIKACRSWIGAELQVLAPERVLCLGGSAAQSVLGYATPVMRARVEPAKPSPLGPQQCFVTLHPSAVLRMTDPASSEEYRKLLRQDLQAFFVAR